MLNNNHVLVHCGMEVILEMISAHYLCLAHAHHWNSTYVHQKNGHYILELNLIQI